MERLNEFELEVLEHLPVEPIGLSLAELADGLLDDRSPAAKGKVRLALERLAGVLGGLHIHTGNDDLGGFAVRLFGLQRQSITAVRKHLQVTDRACRRGADTLPRQRPAFSI